MLHAGATPTILGWGGLPHAPPPPVIHAHCSVSSAPHLLLLQSCFSLLCRPPIELGRQEEQTPPQHESDQVPPQSLNDDDKQRLENGERPRPRDERGHPGSTGCYQYRPARPTHNANWEWRDWPEEATVARNARDLAAGTSTRKRDDAYEIAHPNPETGEPERRHSRGPGSWGSSRACCEMLGHRGTDPVTGETIESTTCLPHIEAIAMGDPNGTDFTFGPAAPSLSVDAHSNRQCGSMRPAKWWKSATRLRSASSAISARQRAPPVCLRVR